MNRREADIQDKTVSRSRTSNAHVRGQATAGRQHANDLLRQLQEPRDGRRTFPPRPSKRRKRRQRGATLFLLGRRLNNGVGATRSQAPPAPADFRTPRVGRRHRAPALTCARSDFCRFHAARRLARRTRRSTPRGAAGQRQLRHHQRTPRLCSVVVAAGARSAPRASAASGASAPQRTSPRFRRGRRAGYATGSSSRNQNVGASRTAADHATRCPLATTTTFPQLPGDLRRDVARLRRDIQTRREAFQFSPVQRQHAVAAAALY